MLAWVDIETTGLDPFVDEILEVAILKTSDDLKQVEGMSFVVRPTVSVPNFSLHPLVKEMHSVNGLFDACMGPLSMSAPEVEEKLLEFVADLPQGKIPLAGSSVGFDRSFLRRYMPRLESYFHYRSVDVSTIKELASRWCPKVTEELAKLRDGQKPKHRAIDDITASLDELRLYKEMMFQTAGASE